LNSRTHHCDGAVCGSSQWTLNGQETQIEKSIIKRRSSSPNLATPSNITQRRDRRVLRSSSFRIVQSQRALFQSTTGLLLHRSELALQLLCMHPVAPSLSAEGASASEATATQHRHKSPSCVFSSSKVLKTTALRVFD
jgi:hypothetical protein